MPLQATCRSPVSSSHHSWTGHWDTWTPWLEAVAGSFFTTTVSSATDMNNSSLQSLEPASSQEDTLGGLRCSSTCSITWLYLQSGLAVGPIGLAQTLMRPGFLFWSRLRLPWNKLKAQKASIYRQTDFFTCWVKQQLLSLLFRQTPVTFWKQRLTMASSVGTLNMVYSDSMSLTSPGMLRKLLQS